MNDIVKRGRELAKEPWRASCQIKGTLDLIIEAIDEIDRLTTENSNLKIRIRAALAVWDMRVEEMNSDADCCKLIIPILKDSVSSSQEPSDG